MCDKRRERVFWLENRCPRCKHNHSLVYKPDLLQAPIPFKCRSVGNPCAHDCHCEWDVAIHQDERHKLKALLRLAEEKDALSKRINKIKQILDKKKGV